MTKKKHKKQDQEQEEPVQADEGNDRDDLLGRLQRLSADYLNYQKRTGREIADAREFANAEIAKDFLAVLDDMERALDHAAEDDPLSEGMQLVHDKAMEILGRHGLKPISAQGEPFDPQRHEAMMTEPSGGYDAPTVLKELQRGYEFRGRVLRPTRVIISSQAADDNPDEVE